MQSNGTGISQGSKSRKYTVGLLIFISATTIVISAVAVVVALVEGNLKTFGLIALFYPTSGGLTLLLLSVLTADMLERRGHKPPLRQIIIGWTIQLSMVILGSIMLLGGFLVAIKGYEGLIIN